MSRFGHIVVLFCLLSVYPASAATAGTDDDPVTHLRAEARRLNLSATEYWHALVHYKPTLLGGYRSQADDDRFFNAKNGRTSPEDELDATISVFFNAGEDEIHPVCRFPSRYYWLSSKLSYDFMKGSATRCPELERWRAELDPGSIDLIFPAAFLNGPSSMFGHTLLRINSRDYRKDFPLVSYALNYAANADETDNALFFSIKGLVGGYPGVFSIVPYYRKLNEYRDIENRDIWEYSLTFSREEVEQLLRHAWELRYINFDYYYLTENCSYHMLSLMEVARPGLELTDSFDTKAIPADTVRKVVDAGLVGDVTYRPSSTTVIKQHAAELDDELDELVIDLTNGVIRPDDERLRSLSSEDYARVLEQSYDYSRYLSSADPSVRDSRAAQNWSLLVARSRSDAKRIWKDIDVPAVRPDESHKTARFAMAAGAAAKESFISLRLRPAYHDLIDPPAGYAPYSQINFLDLSVRYFTSEEQFRLDKLTIINVLSLAPRDDYFDPVSWGVDVGIERGNSSRGKVNAAQLTVDGGLSYPVQGAWVLSGLLEARVKAAKRFDRSYSAGAGVRLNLLRQGSGSSTQLMITGLAYRAGEDNDFSEASIEHSITISRDLSVRLSAARSKDYGTYQNQAELSMHWYF